MRLQRQGRATPVQAIYSGWGGAMLLARALLKKRTFFCELVKTPLVWRDGPPLDPNPITPQQDLKTRRKAETVTKA